ncbi:CPBP family intramembrane glutamic endopeptidase [Brevibacterium linens]|uniref:Abortive infection protein n=1 Tax=Brevibacterium linens TaxID=1703 RepID=A0A0B8ZZI2_BRELN|nr:CPBP family intramembrane glutamic endopeptidase [Brevibacterium linens]KHS51694.1 Abortive infection protein [Brevibacterium linens]
MGHVNASPEPARPSRLAALLLRILVVTAGALLIWLCVIGLTDLLLGAEMSVTKHIANAVGIFVLTVPLALALRSYVDRLPVATLGLRSDQPAWSSLLLGVATWLLPAVVGLGVSLSVGWVEIRLSSSTWELIGAVALLIVLVFTFEAFPEELIFRGYIQHNLSAAMAPWAAVAVQAGFFMLWGTAFWVIGNGWGVLAERAVLFFVMGVVLGVIRHIAGSLWAPIGFHIAFQVTMQLMLGTRYADIDVSSEWIFTLATAVLAFCTATTIAGGIWRGPHNWKYPEPEH